MPCRRVLLGNRRVVSLTHTPRGHHGEPRSDLRLSMKWPLAHDVDSTPFSRWQRTQRFCTTLTESRLQHFTRRPCSRVRRGPLSLDSGPRAGAQGQSVSPPSPPLPSFRPTSRNPGGPGHGYAFAPTTPTLLQPATPLDRYAHPCYSHRDEGPTPSATSPFPLDGGRLEPAPYSIRGWG